MNKVNQDISRIIEVNSILSGWYDKVVNYADTTVASVSLFSIIDNYGINRCLVILDSLSVLIGLYQLDQQIMLVAESGRMAYLVSNRRYSRPSYEFSLWIIVRSQQQLFYVQERLG